MADVHHFDIKVNLIADNSTVLMDGRPLTGVRSICLDVEQGKVSTVTLELDATATVFGDAKVWIKDQTQALSDKTDAAEARADAADIRTVVAEARADAAEASSTAGMDGATLAYIVPVKAIPDGEDRH